MATSYTYHFLQFKILCVTLISEVSWYRLPLQGYSMGINGGRLFHEFVPVFQWRLLQEIQYLVCSCYAGFSNYYFVFF